MIPIFVYGTLREGFFNFDRILKGRTTDIKPATLEGYDMLNLGAFPGIITGDNVVHGELISINPNVYLQTLQILDKLEGYDPSQKGKSLYHREIQRVKLEDGTVADAYVYIYNRKQGITGFSPIESGNWVTYEKKKAINK